MVEGGFALLQTLRGHNGATRWRDGRVVEGNSLENCRRRQSTVGSNPTLSATFSCNPLIVRHRCATPGLTYISAYKENPRRFGRRGKGGAVGLGNRPPPASYA